MWPWGHLAVGYLAYSGFLRHRRGRAPGSAEALLVAFGALFPDLVDKPLAWTFGVLPTGRTLGHSLLIGSIAVAALYWRFGRDRPRSVAAFGVGYLSHPIADLPPEVLTGSFDGATYLLWPALPSPEYELAQSFVAHLVAFDLTGYELFQFLLAGVAVAVWLRDGAPGLDRFRSGWRRYARRAAE